LVALALAAAGTAARGDWEIVPDLGVRVENDNNLFLDPVDEQSDTRGVLDLAARLTNTSQRGNFYVEPLVSLYRYSKPENDILESDDIYVTAGGAYAWQTVEIGFRSVYADQSIMQAEVFDPVPDDPDVEQPPEGDTGRIEYLQQQRQRTYVSPYLELRISDRNRFRFAVDRTDVDYSETFSGAGRYRFDSTTISTALLRRIDDRNAVSATLYVGEYNADETSNHTQTFGVDGTFTRPLSETWELDMTVGLIRTDYEYIDPVTDRLVVNAASDVSFGMNFRKRSELSVWNISLGQSVVPNGSGYMVRIDQLWAYLEQRFTQRFDGEFGVTIFRSRTLDAASVIDDRDFASLVFGFEYAMKPTLFLRFGLNSFGQEFVNENTGVANGQTVYFGVYYRGLSRTNR
jgi:hypothetical protein